jgi:hypothetical protein
MQRNAIVLLSILLATCFFSASCSNKRIKENYSAGINSPRQELLFPSPYFPAHERTLFDKPLSFFSPSWTDACIYSDRYLTDEQKKFISTLLPAGGDGKTGLDIVVDLNRDGIDELLSWGAYSSGEKQMGNFLLITQGRGSDLKVVYLHEFPGSPQMTSFTLKPDGTLYFGGGMQASEAVWQLQWVAGKIVLKNLSD